MRIHKTDGRGLVGGAKDHGFKCWREIMALVAERALHREAVRAERNYWGIIESDYVN